jgi:inorganic pyrophosphatase
MDFVVVVEIPKGSRNKYEIDHESGEIYLDRELFTATRFPTDYGYVVGTEAEDGDPIDALVMVGEPTFPGCRIRCRPIGIFRLRDKKSPDPKVPAVPVWDRTLNWSDVGDVPDQVLREIQHFFDIYRDLEGNQTVEVGEWASRAEAESAIQRARERHGARGG